MWICVGVWDAAGTPIVVARPRIRVVRATVAVVHGAAEQVPAGRQRSFEPLAALPLVLGVGARLGTLLRLLPRTSQAPMPGAYGVFVAVQPL